MAKEACYFVTKQEKESIENVTKRDALFVTEMEKQYEICKNKKLRCIKWTRSKSILICKSDVTTIVKIVLTKKLGTFAMEMTLQTKKSKKS